MVCDSGDAEGDTQLGQPVLGGAKHCFCWFPVAVGSEVASSLSLRQEQESGKPQVITESLPPSCLNLGHLRELLSFPVYLSCIFSSVQFSCSVVSPTLCDPMNHSNRPPCPSPTPKFTQTHVHQVSDAIQPSHPLSSPSPPAPNPSQHQSLFQ